MTDKRQLYTGLVGYWKASVNETGTPTNIYNDVLSIMGMVVGIIKIENFRAGGRSQLLFPIMKCLKIPNLTQNS